jgi:hypothetical protein
MKIKGPAEKIIEASKIEAEDVSLISGKPAVPEPVELMKLPLEERRKILAKAAAEAEDDYLNDPALTDCEAFGDDDLYDETP